MPGTNAPCFSVFVQSGKCRNISAAHWVLWGTAPLVWSHEGNVKGKEELGKYLPATPALNCWGSESLLGPFRTTQGTLEHSPVPLLWGVDDYLVQDCPLSIHPLSPSHLE